MEAGRSSLMPLGAMLVILLAGCAGPAPAPDVTTAAGPEVAPFVPPVQPAPAGPPGPRKETGTAEVYGVAAVNCAEGSGIVAELHWEFIPIERQANDTSLAILLEWQPVNPTANELRMLVRDRDEPAGPVYYDQWGPSPQELVLFRRDLQALNETMYLQVGVDACAAETPIGIQVVDQDQPQRVDWGFAWNTLSDQ